MYTRTYAGLTWLETVKYVYGYPPKKKLRNSQTLHFCHVLNTSSSRCHHEWLFHSFLSFSYPLLLLRLSINPICAYREKKKIVKERNSLKFQFYTSPSFKLFINFLHSIQFFSFFCLSSCPPRDGFVNQLWNLMFKIE